MTNQNCRPLLRFGVMTDNHLDPAFPEMEERTRAAFRLFQKEKIELLVDCGDITDFWQPDQLQNFRRIFEETWPDALNRPQRFWIAAGHDVARHPQGFQAYKEVVSLLGTRELNPELCVNGFYFVGLSQCEDIAILRKNLEAALAVSPDKPVFAVTHEPASRTIHGSDRLGNKEFRELFEKHPRVIQLCGHTHTPVFLDRFLWQGGFTVINAGSLTYWKDMPLGRDSRKYPADDALICDLYADRMVIRRLHALTGMAATPDAVIPLPFQAKTAPYRPEKRRKEFPIAQFPQESNAEFRPDANPMTRGILTLPKAEPADAMRCFRVTLDECENNAWKEIAVLDFCPGTEPDGDRGNREDFRFPVGMLHGETEYRCKIVPVNQYDQEGKPLLLSFRTPASALKELPVSGCAAILNGDKPAKVDDNGEFSVPEGEIEGRRIMLPPSLAPWLGTPVVAVLEFACSHSGNPAVLMACGDKPDWGRHFFPKGDVPQHRHCFELGHLKGKQPFVWLCEGGAGHYRISNVRYYKYEI